MKYKYIFLLIFLLFVQHPAFSEGSREVGDNMRFSIQNTGGTYAPFARAGCTPNYRLYIHIEYVGETILYGMQRESGSTSGYCLKRPNGVAVTGRCGPFPASYVPPAAPVPGYIVNYAQAVAGPYPTLSGYTPLDYTITSIADTGDYFLEFNDACEMQYVDITVVNVYPNPAPSNEIRGRVFSKSWQWYQNGNNLSTTLYIYSDDGIVTASQFSNMQIGRGTFFANATGCYANLTPEENRKSRHRNVAYPQYKIFLNPPDPDPSCFPSGNYGVMTASPEMYPDPALPCTGAEIVKVTVSKAGNVTIKFTFPPPYIEKIFNSLPVVNGVNYINWDGRDGTLPLGVLIPDMTNVTVNVTYINGLTNMPLFDIEDNSNGIKVTLIRPTGASLQNPLVYWDDTEIHEHGPGLNCDGGSNFTGCDPVALPDPHCHNWNSCIGEGSTLGSEHGNTINTWWYSASTTEETINPTHSALPPDPVPTNAARCGPGTVNLSVTVLPGEIAEWYAAAIGGTPFQTGTSYTTPNISVTTTYYVLAKNTFGCYSTNRTPVVATINPFPSPPTAGNNFRCGQGTVTISATPGTGEDVRWYAASVGGSSLLTGNSFTTPSIAATTSYYAETFNAVTNCVSESRTEVIAEVRVVPMVSNAITTEGICSGASPGISLESAPALASFSWTATNLDGRVTGFTSPGNGNLTAEVLNIKPNVFESGVVTYTVTPTLASCAGNTATFHITVNPFPDLTISAASTTTICSGGQTNILLTSQVASVTYQWSASGYSGNIMPPPPVSGLVNPIVQIFSNSGHTVEPVTLYIIPSAAGCTSSATPFIVSVNPVPGVVLPNPAEQIVCSNSPSAAIDLNTDVVGTPVAYSWTTGCETGITPPCPADGNATPPAAVPSATVNNPTYIQQNVTYTITADIGTCLGPAYIYTVKVNPRPDVVFPATPPNPQEVCSGSNTMIPIVLGSHVLLPTVSYDWTSEAFTNLNIATSSISGFVTPNTGSSIPRENLVSILVDPGYVNYSVQATLTANGTACQGAPYIYRVNVGPSPTAVPSIVSQAICSLAPSQQVDFTSNVSPITYEWHVINSSGVNPLTFAANGTTSYIPSQPNIAATGATQGHVTYQITPIYPGGGSFTCSGGVSTSTILVNPWPVTPVITGGTGQGAGHIECENQLGVNYSVPLVTGCAYSWTVTGGTIITGQQTHAISVNWGVAGAATLQLTATDQLLIPNCSSTSLIYNVTLTNRPVPTLIPFNPPSGICQGKSGTYTTENGQFDYTWAIPAGGSVTSGGTTTSNFVTITWLTPGSKTITVNYKNSIGCYGFDPGATTTIEVHPLPVATFTGPTTVCQDFPVASLYPANTGPACSYSWSVFPDSYGTIADNTSATANVNWDNPGSAQLILNGTTSFGCLSSSSQAITINAKPVVALSACFDRVTTANAKPFLLKGGTPLGIGGKYYIDGTLVAGSVLDPSALNPASLHIVSFTYTDANGCLDTANKTITVGYSNAGYSCVNNTFTDPRNPDIATNKYPTTLVAINGRSTCWMLKNLNWGTTTVSDKPQTDNCIIERYCSTNDVTCASNGSLYQWDELMQYGSTPGWTKGVCPPGWHIPTSLEWQDLIDANQGDGVAGGALKDINFSAILSGIYYLNNLFSFTSGSLTATMFWTSTPDVASPDRIIARGLNNYNYSVSLYPSSRANAFPVRCVKDN